MPRNNDLLVMGTSACDGVPFPLRDSLRPAYICCYVIGWRLVRGEWCITRCNLFPKVCSFPPQRRTRKEPTPLLILSLCASTPPSLIALNSNARPITATHPLSTQRIHPQ